MLKTIIEKAFQAAGFTPFQLLSIEEKPYRKGDRLFIPPELLQALSQECFRQLAFYYRPSHLTLLKGCLDAASSTERFVIESLLRNAALASKGALALCQDTGTAIVYGWKPESVCTGGDDTLSLAQGAQAAYKTQHLRASQVGAASFFGEYNTLTNLPAQVSISACGGDACYRLLFVAKGGGSSNKTSFFAMNKALLEEQAFDSFLKNSIQALGAAACPPYRLAVVVGGTSPEFNLEVLKLATTELLDGAPYFDASEGGYVRRDRFWEERAMQIGRETGIGAQFGGEHFLLDARVLRLPRHAASCPVSIGVSCAAHRNILAYVNAEGAFIETMAVHPEAYGADGQLAPESSRAARKIDLNQPLSAIVEALQPCRVGDFLRLSGKVLLARDAAHLKWHERLLAGDGLPEYLFRYPLYYAGPSAAPFGKVIGSLGPTTAARMDIYAEEFLSRGASLITLAKGNRSKTWTQACLKYGGFYLGTIGGAAALLAAEHVDSSEIIDYPELGMEAVRLIEVRDVPAFVLVDNKGNELYERIAERNI
ncbi:FumA C-terminus/TtdB family hydratase beta subunit [Breznakiellaceae bacterium SP9]